VAFILAFWAAGITGDPETVLKKNTNGWQVPIVAKQANENKPTQVVGGYPKLELDTLARPLKSGARPFGQYLSESSSPTIPNHILNWLAQRQSRITTTTSVKPPGGGSVGDEGKGSGITSKDDDQQVEKPSRRDAAAAASAVADQTLKGIPKLGNSPRPKLIQRPAYNPELASKKQEESESDTSNNTTKATDSDEEPLVTFNPKVAAIMMDDYMTRKKDKLSVAGLVIGLTFVAAFISIAIGLVGHGLIKRCRHGNDSGRSSRNSWMRSPGDDEDRTPPELRPGSNCGGSSRRNSGRTRHIPGTLPGHGGTPFFNGKLILHDPPGLANGARGVMRPFNPGNVLGGNSTNGPGGFMMTSPPSKFGGAIPKKMPSPAAQVTDVLVSPKYEDGETTEEEDSDDTVYECPGLGATKGMEVRNPFFMDGGDMQPQGSKLANKKPISQYTDLFHHQEIVGLN